jgi:hypothetical protein
VGFAKASSRRRASAYTPDEGGVITSERLLDVAGLGDRRSGATLQAIQQFA